MKIAIISDIHGNIYALRNIIDKIDDEKVDFIICLGDLVGYGPHPNEVVSFIKRKNILCIKGNYDASVVDGSYTCSMCGNFCAVKNMNRILDGEIVSIFDE